MVTYTDPDLFIERVFLAVTQADLILRRDGGWVVGAAEEAEALYALDAIDYDMLFERVASHLRSDPYEMLDIPDGTV